MSLHKFIFLVIFGFSVFVDSHILVMFQEGDLWTPAHSWTGVSALLANWGPLPVVYCTMHILTDYHNINNNTNKKVLVSRGLVRVVYCTMYNTQTAHLPVTNDKNNNNNNTKFNLCILHITNQPESTLILITTTYIPLTDTNNNKCSCTYSHCDKNTYRCSPLTFTISTNRTCHWSVPQ